MDPQAALDACERAFNDGKITDARNFLINYRRWRANGGFEPPGGDTRADELRRRIYNWYE